MLNIFEFSLVDEIVSMSLDWFMFMQMGFHDSSNHVSWPRQQNKLLPPFSYFLELLGEENIS